MPCRDVSTPPGEQCLPCLPRRNTPRLLGLCAMMTICGALIVAGCYISRTIDQATASDVNNRNFTFANGAVFHAALAFSNNAQNFTLTSAGTISGTATGTSSVAGSCILTVTTSTYSAGPQRNDIITLNPCTYNSSDNTLTVTNLGLPETSAPGQVR